MRHWVLQIYMCNEKQKQSAYDPLVYLIKETLQSSFFLRGKETLHNESANKCVPFSIPFHFNRKFSGTDY